MSVEYGKLKFNYTLGGEYTLTGTNYVGYFNIIDGIAYSERYYTTGISKQLVASNKIRTDLYASEMFPDRLIVDTLTLPASISDLEIPPDEIVSSKIFNSHIKKIYDNSLYIYTNLFIASNDIPVGYTAVAAVSGGDNQLKWHEQDGSSAIGTDQAAEAGLDELDRMNGAVVALFENGEGFAMFAYTDTHFVALSSDSAQTSISVLLSSTYVDNNTIKEYETLSSIALSGYNLYLSDSSENYVYKYDIRGFINGDKSIQNKRYFVEMIGGPGGFDRKNKFNTPTIVTVAYDWVYVYDSGNDAIKVYDKNMVYLFTKSYKRQNISICDIKFYELHNLIYMVINRPDGTSEIWINDRELNVIETVVLQESTRSSSETYIKDRKGKVYINKELNEVPCKLAFSYQDSNIFYVISNRGVYKKFISRPDKTIGKWLFNKSGLVYYHIWNFEMVKFNEDYIFWNTLSGGGMEDFIVSDFQIIPQPGNADTVYLFAKTGVPAAGRILHYNEFTAYDSTLYAPDISLYTKNRLGESPDEYVQGITFNKEIYKQAYNLLLLKNLIRGRFKGEFDEGGNLVYRQYIYLNDAEVEKLIITSIENMEVHDNEIVSSEAINRSFRVLYNLQQAIIDTSATSIANILPSAALTGQNIISIL